MTFESAARALAAFIGGASLLLFCAYAIGIQAPIIYPPPWSCVGFMAAALSLWLLGGARTAGSALLLQNAGAVLTILLGTVVWSEFLINRSFGIDALLFPGALLTTVPHPGRPAPASGFNFVLVGSALLLVSRRGRARELAGELCAVTSFVFCYLGLVNFMLSTGRGPASREVMVPMTAAMFLAADVGLLITQPPGRLLTLLQSPGPSGIFARWLMPVPLVLPALTALARSAGIFDSRLGSSILPFFDILAAILIVWGSSTQVLRLDRLRRRAEEEVRESRDDLDRRVRVRTHELVDANRRLEEEIAEREKAERELQLTNATLNNVIETSPLAICAFTPDGRVRKRNPAAEAMLDPHAPEIRDVIARAARGERIDGLEITRLSDGRPVHLNVWASPLPSPEGGPDSILMMSVDISERKAFEEHLRYSQKLESLGVLAGGIAHDFNNLLTGIMGNASLAMDALAVRQPAQRYLDQIVSASQRAADLTRQLLAYAGKGRFVLELVNLSELIGGIAGLIQASIPRSVQLHLELDESIPAIEADANQIQQAVMNLIINGCEAITDSGTITISTGKQRFEDSDIRSRQQPVDMVPGDYVWLGVTDTGAGIDEKIRARMFDPFFTTKFTGRGLGLAAVQGIVRGHKGSLDFHTEPGAGTTFRLFFPASDKQRQRAAMVGSAARGEREAHADQN